MTGASWPAVSKKMWLRVEDSSPCARRESGTPEKPRGSTTALRQPVSTTAAVSSGTISTSETFKLRP